MDLIIEYLLGEKKEEPKPKSQKLFMILGAKKTGYEMSKNETKR